MSREIGVKLRWRIAYWLDRFRWSCWANLVSWALYGDTYRIRAVFAGAECRGESRVHRDRACYCAKFRDGCLAKAVPNET